MEYRRQSPGEALLLPDKAAEIQIKGHIALFPWPKGGADFTSYTGAANICTTDGEWRTSLRSGSTTGPAGKFMLYSNATVELEVIIFLYGIAGADTKNTGFNCIKAGTFYSIDNEIGEIMPHIYYEGVLDKILEERACPICGCKMHVKSQAKITLRHIPLGGYATTIAYYRKQSENKNSERSI